MYKKIIKKILHGMAINVIAIFLIATVLLNLVYLTTPYLQSHQAQIEQIVSEALNEHVQISSIVAGHHGIEPVITLRDVTIITSTESKESKKENQKTDEFSAKIGELKLAIDPIASLLHWTLTPRLLLIKHAMVNVPKSFANTSAPSQLLRQQNAFRIRIEDSQIVIGSILRNTLTVDNLKAFISWKALQTGEFLIDVKDAAARNDGLKVEGNIQLTLPASPKNDVVMSQKSSASSRIVNQSPITAESTPLANLDLSFTCTDIAAIKQYYPAALMSKELLTWLDAAFVNGKKVSGRVILQGRLANFPYDKAEDGKFFAEINVSNLTFNYFKDWPEFTNVDGKLEFHGRSLRIDVSSANVMNNAHIYNVKANIPDLADAILDVDGRVDALTSDGMRFIFASPLKTTVGDRLKDLKLDGGMDLHLKLSIPISENQSKQKHVAVAGDINLADNELQLVPWNINFNKLNGEIKFTEADLSSDKITAEFFGQPITLNIQTLQPQGAKSVTQVNLEGKIYVQELLNTLSLLQLGGYVTGAADCKALVKIIGEDGKPSQKTVELNSDLFGVKVDLPEPLGKPANSNKNFTLHYIFGSTANNAPEPQVLSFNYGKELNAKLFFATDSHADIIKFVSGELNFGIVAKPISAIPSGSMNGLNIFGTFSKANWEEWRKYLFDVKNRNSLKEAIKYINKITLDITELQILRQTLKPVRLEIMPKVDFWQCAIKSPKIFGILSIPVDYSKNILQGRFQRFYLDISSNYQTGTKVLATMLSPRDVPSLYFISDDFHYGNKAFGELELKARAESDGLTIDSLKINNDGFTIDAIGRWWVAKDGVMQSIMRGRFASNDVGALLKQWGFTESLVGGKGAMNFQLHWNGPFYDPTLRIMDGSLTLLLKDGRIINIGDKTSAEMGIGRVLNLLSLQSLPRRLTLDFSDLLKSGFSFDEMRGDFKLDKGNVFAQRMNIDSTVAQIKMHGRIGLQAHDYDMRLVVIPSVTSSLPVIATVAGGPVVGAATWVADKLLGKQVGRIVSYVYKVTGSWVNPTIEKI